MKQFVAREATGVFAWSLISCLVRVCLSFLVAFSTLNYNGRGENDSCSDPKYDDGDSSCNANANENPTDDDSNGSQHHSALLKELITMLAILLNWALVILPPKVRTISTSSSLAPGFTFGSTWILYPLRDTFGFIPNLPCRICETTMGRLSLRELAMILPIHFLIPAMAFWFLQLFMPATIFSSYAIDPVIYSERNPWAVDFVRETLVNALFTVGLLVTPELLRINGIRRGYALLILYPLYSFSVDAKGKASIFGPNLIYSLRCINTHEEVPITQWCHLLGPIFGGYLGGKIMAKAFPDGK